MLGVALVIATAAAKIAPPECTKLKKEKMLKILNFVTLSNLAQKMEKENNLQNKIFLNLCESKVARVVTNPTEHLLGP